jgi:hypothetical protein
MDLVAVAVDGFSRLPLDLVPHVRRDPMLPAHEEKVRVRVLDAEPVVLELLDQIGDAQPSVVPRTSQHDLRDQKPARIVVDPLVGTCPYFFVNSLQDGIVRFHRHDVHILFVLEQIV